MNPAQAYEPDYLSPAEIRDEQLRSKQAIEKARYLRAKGIITVSCVTQIGTDCDTLFELNPEVYYGEEKDEFAGFLRRGWFLDGVYLGDTVRNAIKAVEGN
jgi:hypothetical protein